MKTAIVFDKQEDGVSLHVFDGDYRSLEGVYVNGNYEEHLMEEVNTLMTDEKGYFAETVSYDTFIQAIKDDAFLISCGFYL